jgi:Tol biopolymer transport system component
MFAKSFQKIFNATGWVILWSMSAASLAMTGLAQTPTTLAGYKVEWITLGPWDEKMDDFAFSSDGRHFAYVSSQVCQKAKTRCIILDGKESLTAEDFQLGTLALSPDGKRVAYAGKRDKQSVIVIDGQPGTAYDEIEIGSVEFSPDGERIAFVAKVDGKYSMVVDGKASASFDEILNPARSCTPGRNLKTHFSDIQCYSKNQFWEPWRGSVMGFATIRSQNPPAAFFSPDGKRLAFLARNAKQWFMVLDGQALALDGFRNRVGQYPHFSPDSTRFAYVAQQGKRCAVLVDGQEIGPGYKDCWDLTFSPDGKHVAFEATEGSRNLVVVDGQTLSEYRVISELRFSPDSKHLMYVAGGVEKWYVMTDAQVGPAYPGNRDYGDSGNENYTDWGISQRFSPDGKHLAYVVHRDETNGHRESMYLDGHAVKSGINPGIPVFSPDSAHMAFTMDGGVILDGNDLVGRMFLLDGSPSFAPDGTLEALVPSKGVLFRLRCVPAP